ncbi:MAG: DUF1761 domain-containing protein [Nannocystis sp.]|uniref:DUF1761 domain-containing protein n=1 Tax=Nannocystis sp. TaxID=1962667 RepID=UPI00242290A9|nr:DUF1761 domain-containing protein [Nannocystis sp.]MBK9752344.1 DUF1761 domain-containing protein [Nannocystis sp.]
MDLATALTQINYFAVVTAAVSSFFVGGLWYSPALFARPWLQDCRLRETDLVGAGPVFAGAFACAMLEALVLTMFVDPHADVVAGAVAGLLIGLGWVAPALTTTFLFERRPRRLLAIDAGYHVVTFTLMGAILGAWP